MAAGSGNGNGCGVQDEDRWLDSVVRMDGLLESVYLTSHASARTEKVKESWLVWEVKAV